MNEIIKTIGAMIFAIPLTFVCVVLVTVASICLWIGDLQEAKQYHKQLEEMNN